MLTLSKQECRKLFNEKRKLIAPHQLRVLSEKISTLLFTNFNLENKLVSLFLPIEQKKEINTYIILDKAINLNASICIPKANFENNELKHFLYEGPEQLETSVYQIPEPKYGKIISPKKIDIVIIPLIACDKTGNRVGYGKGFYDRFLKKCSSSAIFIGISLFEPIDKLADFETNDIALHYLITPDRKINFDQRKPQV